MIKADFPGGLSEIADSYDAILCDVWGVIHNGRQAFAEACEALVRFREVGGRVVLITNAPVPKAQVIKYFTPLGVPEAAFDDCVSSGDATRNALEKRADKSFWLLGVDESWSEDRHLYAGLDLDFTSPETADTILCMGLGDRIGDHPEDYRSRLKAAADRGMDMICANPDIKVRVGDNLIWCGGALAKVFEEEGGAVIYPGKPHRAIYDLAGQKLEGLGLDPKKARILCIGDSPGTDLKGAAQMGYDSLYVGTGLQKHGQDFGKELTSLLESYEIFTKWAMPALKW